MNKVVGVLALQGAYQKHIDLLHVLGVSTRSVRHAQDLTECSALIIPGGESTTMSLLLQDSGLFEPIKSFANNHPVMGICAGMILMATDVDDERVTPLELIPFTAVRNHYGRQVHSFTSKLNLDFDQSGNTFQAHFIRAPGIENLSPGIKVLARYNEEAVMISSGKHLALSFHPELTKDTRIHNYWLSNANQELEYENINHC